METVENWGDAVMVSATEAMQNLLGFLPALIGAILILIIGWIIAGILAGLIEKGLKTIGFEKAAQSTGIAGFIENAGSGWTAGASGRWCSVTSLSSSTPCERWMSRRTRRATGSVRIRFVRIGSTWRTSTP